ncbi:bifunctional hydroxymethylpyrimidine kinase/phosphomethylpyrimidine kinase [Candidatus Woesearchaeota archaeon]|nr:bifunctional hydroxymethylpyrimidine kinase/phosphomethylpyrimidine kinase [Candidatus Woesearchaeota archaeon]
MVDVVIVGSVALDTVKTPFGKVDDALGGAATFASFAASFFAKPGIVAVVGSDFPQQHLQLLKSRGIDLKGVCVEGLTFRWEGYYEYDMNEAKTIKTELGSFASFRPQLPEDYREAEYVFLANIDPELQLNVLNQIKKPKLTVMDTMNYWIQNKREKLMEVVKKADVLLLNDSEARQLFSTPNLVRAANEALKLGPKYVIIKKGEHGALMFSGSTHFNAPGYPLENVRDPTGSGDSFAGAFIGYIAKTKDASERSIRKAIIYGSSVASFNAEDFSLDRLKQITAPDIEGRYREFGSMREF